MQSANRWRYKFIKQKKVRLLFMDMKVMYVDMRYVCYDFYGYVCYDMDCFISLFYSLFYLMWKRC